MPVAFDTAVRFLLTRHGAGLLVLRKKSGRCGGALRHRNAVTVCRNFRFVPAMYKRDLGNGLGQGRMRTIARPTGVVVAERRTVRRRCGWDKG